MADISDDMITAWLDGEVTAAQRAEIEAAVSASPALGLRIARLSRADRLLAPAFAETLNAPIPKRFEVLFDKPRRAFSLEGMRSALAGLLAPRALMMAAAALGVGVFVGVTVLAGRADGTGLDADGGGRLLANSDMAADLASLPSGPSAAAMRIRLSMIDGSGRYCRQFETVSVSGLACLEDGRWSIDTVSGGAGASGHDGRYVMADGAPDPAIVAALDRRGMREMLDQAQEAAAIAAGWK